MASDHSHSNDIPCPDPSVHEKNDRLSAQASTAALYVTQPHKGTDPRQPKEDVLGKDGKLSSRSAATSLKHAKATDLPSFPSHGGDSSAAGAAASLAKDYKMKDLWQPEQSMAGSKAAAKAQKDGGKLELWQYEGSKNGLSAAALAMRKNTQTPLAPTIDRGYTDAGKNNSLLAATKSTRSNNRQRSDSTPASRPTPLYPDEKNSARNALNAATVSHRKSVREAPVKKEKEDGWSSEANQAARIKHSHMDKEMFGSSPPVEPELEERKREAALRASAVSMAKKMYDVQNRAMLASPSDTSSVGSAGAETAHRRNASNISQPDLKQEAMKYITLQDQAHKLAQERLAKVDKNMENSKYREYYGYSDRSPRKSRLSIRGRTRNRASSEGADNGDSDDEEQARRIRSQMSQLNTASNTVSDKQRQEDRARLLKAAEKRVHDRIHDMDEKVFLETGKPSQAMMDDWEAKAREKAERDRVEREKHPGKTHIGGGKYMDQSEIEAIAAARLKPTLDELNDNAEKKRERDVEIARKRDQAETERMEEKMKSDQQKAEFKKMKEQDKAAADAKKMEEKRRSDQQKAEFRKIKDQDKAAAKKEKEERKAAQREEKVRKSEDLRKSRDMKREEAAAALTGAASKTTDDDEAQDEPQEDVKEKRKSRGVFGRLTDKFKKDDRPASQGEKTEGKTSKEEERGRSESVAVATASQEKDSMYEVSERNAEGAREVDSKGEMESVADQRSSTVDKKESEEEKDESHAGTAAAVAAGTAGAGGLAWATTRRSSDKADDEKDEVSSLSSANSERNLQQVETAHSALPLQSPVLDKRPDLERHISAIPDSSGESESEELSDSDDDEDRRGRKEGQEYFGTATTASKADNVPAVEEPVSPLNEPTSKVDEDMAKEPVVPALTPAPKETEDSTAAPAEGDKAAPTTAAAAAAAPVIATGPSTSENRGKVPEKSSAQEEKEGKRGFRGLISRLKGKDKDGKSSDSGSGGGKLHKTRSSTDQQQSEKGFQGGAKLTSPRKRTEGEGETITPVTTTTVSAGNRESVDKQTDTGTGTGTLDSADSKPLPMHMGTDGPIGDPEGRASVASASAAGREGARASTGSPTSASSFKRHDADLRDPDEVSSSGAEEDDLQRGRGRGSRFARKLGFGRHRDRDNEDSTAGAKDSKTETAAENDTDAAAPTVKTTSPSASRKDNADDDDDDEGERPSEEQFEEARDTFDESLAPPAAFAGQPKSQSPVRETKFTERF